MAYVLYEHFAIGNASAETRDIIPKDRRLREHGFVIIARPCVGEAVWERNRVRVAESVALAICDREDIESKKD